MIKDGHIRLLSMHVANKIAAGEVVERPASVVKELMENAIDAGATRIDVKVTAGGRKLIEIRDNGCGMGRDDALLSMERQATSKIRDVDDIEQINTLGFRGEALPSIASVARFTLKTRRATEESGTELTINGGALQDVREAGLPVGTTIEVRDLFFNVPARRKFLRSYQTEQAHIKAHFTLHALAHPAVGMSLTSDGREIIRVPPDATLEERARELLGADFCANLRPVDKTTGAAHVYGFVGLPNQTRSDRSEQYIFINRRPATAPIIYYALREAYPPLDRDRKPIVLLFIDLAPDDVDVNVHPAKREVRFRKPREISEAIIQAVGSALTPQPSEPAAGALGTVGRAAMGESFETEATGAMGEREATPPVAGDPPVTLRSMVPEAAAAAVGAPFVYPKSLPTLPTPTAPDGVPAPYTAQPVGRGLPLLPETPGSAPWSEVRLLGQLGERYLLLETDNGLVTLDPRAARERVMYEYLVESSADGAVAVQKLLLPETVKLEARDAERLRKYLAVMQGMGFAVDELSGDYFIVEALPAILGNVSCRELLGNIVHDIESAGTQRGAAKWREELVAQAACRAFAGMDLALHESAALELVAQLARAKMPYTCPRGRPTMIQTSWRELDRKFSR